MIKEKEMRTTLKFFLQLLPSTRPQLFGIVLYFDTKEERILTKKQRAF